MTKQISAALLRALQAVNAGQVVRKAGRRDSKMQGPHGVGAQSLWLAKMNGFITDGPERSGALIISTKQVLTDAGLAAMTRGESERNDGRTA